jgi:protein-S-isoprenylcysteine O-methyltransferase Ste14
MLLGVFAVLLGEAVLAESVAILFYLCLVAGAGCWYVVAIEEKELEARFGDAYRVYTERVPRWVPHLLRKG